MERGTGTVEKKGRYFDPYTGADLVLRMRILELEQEQQEEGGGIRIRQCTSFRVTLSSVTLIEFEVEISSTSPELFY